MEEGGRGDTKEREDEAEEGWRDVQGEKASAAGFEDVGGGPQGKDVGNLQQLRITLANSQQGTVTSVLQNRRTGFCQDLNELGNAFILRVSRETHSPANTSVSAQV